MFSARSYGLAGKGFLGERPLPTATPAIPNIITFISGSVDAAPIYDTTGPGIAPPVVILAPLHPAASDFTQQSGGSLLAGNTRKILYSVGVYELAQPTLSLNVVGQTYQQSDITSVSFVGADHVSYNLAQSDSFTLVTDNSDPTLLYSRWEWFGEISSTAFAIGVETSLTIVAAFDFGN